MNKVILSGRLTRDPDIRHTAQGTTVAKATLAVDRVGKKEEGQQTADFPSVTAFGKTAEFIEKYCAQGTKLIVCGRLQTGSYTDRDGKRVFTTDVVLETAEFAESKRTANETQDEHVAGHPSDAGDGFMDIQDTVEDELPFN